MTNHRNCSVLSLHLEFTPDHELLSIHPTSSQSVPACSPNWSRNFSPGWENSQIWCLQGAQTQLADADTTLQMQLTNPSWPWGSLSWQKFLNVAWNIRDVWKNFKSECIHCHTAAATGAILVSSPSGRAALGVLLVSQNPRMGWVGRDLRDDLLPPLYQTCTSRILVGPSQLKRFWDSMKSIQQVQKLQDKTEGWKPPCCYHCTG